MENQNKEIHLKAVLERDENHSIDIFKTRISVLRSIVRDEHSIGAILNWQAG